MPSHTDLNYVGKLFLNNVKRGVEKNVELMTFS